MFPAPKAAAGVARSMIKTTEKVTKAQEGLRKPMSGNRPSNVGKTLGNGNHNVEGREKVRKNQRLEAETVIVG